jgi:hypothetical protein
MQPQAQTQHHKGWLHRRHCVDCQRAYAKAHDGVDIPAPPPIVQGGVHGQVVAANGGACAVCPGGVVSGPIANGGYAMADGAGYAVVGEAAPGADPSPIGVSRAGQAKWGNQRVAAAGAHPGGGPYDSAVVPANLPPGQVALASPEHNRPHVVSHLLGLPIAGTRRRERAEKEREKHAAIAYDQPKQQVTELPASMVYGNKK